MTENDALKEKDLAQQAAAQQAAGEVEAAGAAALCKHCGAALDPDSAFCPNCGEKVGGEELTCEFCQTKTSKEFCLHCGRRVIPRVCPRYGAASIYDACENCGTILNPVLEAVLTQEAAEPAVMSAEEAAAIEAEFKALEETESAEFKAFQKKLIERQILLEERDYFNKREKRVIKTFGTNPLTLELPDPAEEVFRMKAYAALENTVIEKQEKAIQAELEKLFPELPPAPAALDTEAEQRRLAEIEQNQAEMEKQFNAMVAKVENEIDEFRREEERKRIEAERKRLEEERRRLEEERRRVEAERKRKEEEARRLAEERAKAEAERRRLMEIERRRLEQERYENRLMGLYYCRVGAATINLSIRSKTSASVRYYCTVCKAHVSVSYSVNYDGASITLKAHLIMPHSCTYKNRYLKCFVGSINNDGTVIEGYYTGNNAGQNDSATFYKQQ
jgi:RNA polymerase subunit RPABC4/transcription elongation factor Spt4